MLSRKDPEAAERLHHELDEHIHRRQERLVSMSKGAQQAQQQQQQVAPAPEAQPPSVREGKGEGEQK